MATIIVKCVNRNEGRNPKCDMHGQRSPISEAKPDRVVGLMKFRTTGDLGFPTRSAVWKVQIRGSFEVT